MSDTDIFKQPVEDEDTLCFQERMAQAKITVMPDAVRDAPRWAQVMWEEGAVRTQQNAIQGEMIGETHTAIRKAEKRMDRLETTLAPVVKTHRLFKLLTGKATIGLTIGLGIVATAFAKTWVEKLVERTAKQAPTSTTVNVSAPAGTP